MSDVQERVRVIVLRAVDSYGPVGLDSVSRANIASYVVSGLLSAGLLRGDDDLPAGLRAELVDLLCDAGTSSIRLEYPGKWHARRMALLRVLTGAGASEAPAKPTRRMQAQGLKPHHNFEHQEVETCAVFPPCQPVAEPERCPLGWCNMIRFHAGPCRRVPEPVPPPVEDRPPVVGDVIDFIDEHGNEWTRSRRVEAWLAATPEPCRHPGAVAVETVYERLSSNFGGGWQRAFRHAAERERVTALFCPTPGCEKRIEVKHD